MGGNTANLTKLSTLNVCNKRQLHLDTATLTNGEAVISQRKTEAEKDNVVVVRDSVAASRARGLQSQRLRVPAPAPPLPSAGHYK